MNIIKFTGILLLSLLAFGCSHNDGDIGPLFGTWRLESVTADGADVDLHEDGSLLIDWRFQSHLIQIQTVFEHYSYQNVMGTWQMTEHPDRILALDFSGHNVDGTGFYTPPSQLHLVRGGVTPLTIERLNGKDLRLSYTSADGVTYAYKLRKAY